MCNKCPARLKRIFALEDKEHKIIQYNIEITGIEVYSRGNREGHLNVQA